MCNSPIGNSTILFRKTFDLALQSMTDKDLETERLKLRSFTQNDIDTYAHWLSDANIMQYIGEGKTRNHKEAWNNLAWIIGHWELRGYGLWAVEEKESGELIGRIGLFNPEGWPGIELSWLLASTHWGKGYATEGAKTALEFGFNKCHPNSLISMIHPDNDKSIRVAERLGMQYDTDISFSGVQVHKYIILAPEK